jgi:transposase
MLLDKDKKHHIILGMAYSDDFRKRVIAYKDSGHTFKEVYEAFGVRAKNYYAWKKQINENGKFVRKYPTEHEGKINPQKLKELVKEHPDWYLDQYAKVFGVCHQAVQKRFAKMRISRKKNFHLQRKV